MWYGLRLLYVWITLTLLSMCAYVTHLVWTIDALAMHKATLRQLIFAVLGCTFPPLGIVHGVGLWFHAFAWAN